MEAKNYYTIGLMSGSSMDGLDLAYSRISFAEGKVIDWELIAAETIAYSEKWRDRLLGLTIQDALIFAKTNTYYGHYIAELVNEFVVRNQIGKVDFIASHGHTIFHDPDRKISVQIGDGAAIAAITGFNVITDFRTQDIALEGEGAPLAPLADKYLFEGFDFYLNLGGIANLSVNTGEKWIAFDCCPANQILNMLANEWGANYDKDGLAASKGEVNEILLNNVAALPYYTKEYPKSLGNNWIKNKVMPIYLGAECSVEDKLATACEHIAIEIASSVSAVLKNENISRTSFRLLVSGGGAYNQYLLDMIYQYCNRNLEIEFIIPSRDIIEYKEALLMSLLGILKMEGLPNSMASVTGALRDTVNGAYFHGNPNNKSIFNDPLSVQDIQKN